MSKPLVVVASSLLLAALALPARAGSAELNCPDLNALADAGITRYDREATVAELGRHLQALAERGLGADEKLQVELLDLDQAGTMRIVGGGREVRVVRGMADWPRISLSYTLTRGSEVLRSGSEQLSDVDFTGGMRGFGPDADRPLYYEKRMLAAWFETRFGSERAAAAH